MHCPAHPLNEWWRSPARCDVCEVPDYHLIPSAHIIFFRLLLQEDKTDCR